MIVDRSGPRAASEAAPEIALPTILRGPTAARQCVVRSAGSACGGAADRAARVTLGSGATRTAV
ncbi:hypothetical protein IU450_17745 [Nocardia abscessus]|uniref:hypothetical protein n=1 Tax=Nocardia abscessus TaxID=120957 RepID=UPI00189463BD|nr:hypothetical protein [Nocardia abscessus]MBF6337724.1 hypothetical protein [Nocardia abscessus]